MKKNHHAPLYPKLSDDLLSLQKLIGKRTQSIVLINNIEGVSPLDHEYKPQFERPSKR